MYSVIRPGVIGNNKHTAVCVKSMETYISWYKYINIYSYIKNKDVKKKKEEKKKYVKITAKKARWF